MNILDKEEFRVKLGEINKLVEARDYKGAMQIVDSIDWRRVKNVRTLCVVGEIYAANKRYEESKEIFLLAYHRAPIGKNILYRLIEVSLKMGQISEATEFFDEYREVAGNDNSQYILRYKIARAKNASLNEQIRILEEYKEKEFTERWSYELAKLYYKAGDKQKCLDLCNEMILWFNDGNYVMKALDLKQRMGVLTGEEKEKYEQRFIPKLIPPEKAKEIRESKETETAGESEYEESRPVTDTIQVDDELIRVRRGEDIYINSGAHVLEMFSEIVNYSVNVPYVSIYLEGYDSEPRVMLQSELNNIVYRNIPVGTYRFHLAVLDDKGKVTVTENIYTIIKKAEMYDNWWFKIYMVAVFAIIVAYITWIIFHTQVKRTLDFQKKELEFVKKQLEMGNETVMTIARTVDAKDINTSQHSLRVSEYSVLIAKALGYNEDECENLKKAALLHDIGKIGIPDRILNKPDRLTDEEYALMKSHVEKGAQILKNFTLINHVEEGALYHHERYDGSGYMYGLKGEEIPLNARIIGIADAFDAMTANRVYRKKLDKDYVIREIKRGSGTQFDPKLVEIMLGLIEKGLIDIDNLYKDGENHGEQ